MSKININKLEKIYDACEKGDVEFLKEMLSELEELQKNIPKDRDHTPLIIAADSGFSEIVGILVKHGANVNYKTDLGETALDLACSAKDAKSVKILLENGANPLSIDRFGMSVLQRTEDSGEEIISMIKSAVKKREEEIANNLSFFQKLERFFGF